MSVSLSRPVICAILCLVTLGSGIWVSQLGRPLNTAIFTVHKLVALATVIFIAVNVRKLYPDVDAQTIALGVIALTALLFVALFVSGGVLSVKDSAPLAALRVHQIVPLLVLIASSGTMYLLVTKAG